jgi:hypothetical protein
VLLMGIMVEVHTSFLSQQVSKYWMRLKQAVHSEMTLLLIPGSNSNFKLKTSATESRASHLDPCTFNMMEHMHPS